MMKSTNSKWTELSTDECESICLNGSCTLAFLALITMICGMFIEKNGVALIDDYPIIKVAYILTYLLGVGCLMLSTFLIIWKDTISCWINYKGR